MSNNSIDMNYSKFYNRQKYVKVYPTEFVVRVFLSQYPELKFNKPKAGDSVLDVGFGDGRNTAFLCDLALDVCGVEISEEIVAITKERLEKLGHTSELKVGRNSKITYESNRFDYILACHACYYCDEGQTIEDNMKEYARVLKPGGFLIASVADAHSYIFKNSTKSPDGTFKIISDPYSNRVGYRLHAFESASDIEACFSQFFTNFSFGLAHNNYFGIDEKVFWVVCQKI